MSDDTKLTPEDRKLLSEIMDEHHPETFAALVYAYYHDQDRADRTSRAQMYLHLGMACGQILKLADGRSLR